MSSAMRGRGTLEVSESTNPFFQTTSSRYGKDLRTIQSYDVPNVPFRQAAVKSTPDDFDFSFQHSRESAQIGVGVQLSDSRLAKAFSVTDSRADIASAKGRGLQGPVDPNAASVSFAGTGGPDDGAAAAEYVPPVEKTKEEQLESFMHHAKNENPMYTTTNNQIGFKRPSAATFTFERVARSQNFSNAFNGIKYRDQGLNTAVTKSSVHSELDPQFL